MDKNEAGVGGYGGDSSEHCHRNEAISAIADDGFLGEEDDDYEDLYNDVNVGENFLQSLRKNEDYSGHRNEEVVKNQAEVAPSPRQVVESGAVGLRDEVASSRVPGEVDGYKNDGFRGNSNINANDVGDGKGTGALGGSGFRVELGQSSHNVADLGVRPASNSCLNNPQMVQHEQPHTANIGSHENVGHPGAVNGTGGNMYGSDIGTGRPGGGGGGTILFVGDLHWWTTDAEIESELCRYGPIKEVKFFDERASGKSKGYCQVEFYSPEAATACKEGMNGHMFNGRPCVVAYASPYTVKRMGEAQVNRNQQQMSQAATAQPRRGPGDAQNKTNGIGSNTATGGNHQGVSENNGRGFGRGNWGRGNSQGGMGNRGQMGPMRGRAGGMGMRGFTGNGNGFVQGIGAAPPMLHPQAMMGQGFDPTFGGPMGRLGTYGGFPGGAAAPFSGVLPTFGPMGGLPGIAPHVNPAFFGRGVPLNGMGMMPNPGVEGPNMGIWSDSNMGGWSGEEPVGRVGESSYGEEAASEHQYGEGSQERGPRPNSMKEKDRGSERDWSESSERRYRDDRGAGYDRDAPRENDMGRDRDWSERRHRDDRGVERERERERDTGHEHSLDHERDRGRYRDDRDRYADHHRYKNREAEYDDERDRGRSSRTHSKSRLSHDEDQRSRSKDTDYGKRRRLTSE